MRRVFGVKKEKALAPTVEEATQRINKRGDTIDEKVKKLDGELFRYREQIKKTRPGPAQEAIKARAMRILKQKKNVRRPA
jgi:charged multivesicular body protein 5